MLDPFPFGVPPSLSSLTKEYASKYNFDTLHLHIHEIIFAALLYHSIYKFVSPAISSRLFPKVYSRLDRRTKINWDVHFVSLIQSLTINILAVYVMYYDEEIWNMDSRERIWGYTGANGLIVAFATGYFLWDLWNSTWYFSLFGFPPFAHAIAALAVYSFGFRPFVNYYATGFILFELSSPFLNFHWYFDKLDMTGSWQQLVNGIILTSTFFAARLVWGSFLSLKVFKDIYRALKYQNTVEGRLWLETMASDFTAKAASAIGGEPAGEVLRYAQNKPVPMWMAVIYLAANVTLMGLNVIWFRQMIDAIRKRFSPPFGTRKEEPAVEKPVMGRGIYADGTRTVEVDSKQVKQRIGFNRLASDAPPPK